MNAPAFLRSEDAVPHRLTVDDVSRMVEVGLLDPDLKTELIDGVLWEMPHEGEPHLNYKVELVRFFARALSDDLRVAPDATLHLGPTNAPEPDLYVFEAAIRLMPIDPVKVRLLIEIADTSVSRDLGMKRPLYAEHGISEYWVVEVQKRRTHVLTQPSNGAYGAEAVVPFKDVLQPSLIPGLTLRISDLPIFGAD